MGKESPMAGPGPPLACPPAMAPHLYGRPRIPLLARSVTATPRSAENLPNMGKETVIQVQEVQRVPGRLTQGETKTHNNQTDNN